MADFLMRVIAGNKQHVYKHYIGSWHGVEIGVEKSGDISRKGLDMKWQEAIIITKGRINNSWDQIKMVLGQEENQNLPFSSK